LTEKQVVEIRKKYRFGDTTQMKLSRKYEVSREAIKRIIHGDNWSHVGGPTSKGNRQKLTEAQAKEIRWLLKNSEYTQSDISSVYPITESTVSDICRGESWSNAGEKSPPASKMDELQNHNQ
jgi:DNA-binding transcriptional regulator LsrR (DeoR family)